MSIEGRKICVVGAGIGGLAVARALALRGADVVVLEQADAIREVGAGLQISPNGFAVLRALGLGPAVTGKAVQGQVVSLRDYRKGEVARLDLTGLALQDYWFCHRADLINTLAEGARGAGVKIRLLQRVERVEPGSPSRVALANGATTEADLIIGADGLHSIVRSELNGAAAPFFTGQAAWRAVVRLESPAPPIVRLYMAPHRHLVVYPLRDSRSLNIVAVQERAAWTAESWSQEDDPDAMRAAFSDFGAEAQDILNRVNNVHLWGLFRHPVAPRWFGEGLALLGDAAHPTLPFLAQGANMALEDAWVLADVLARHGLSEPSLSRYQGLRRDRAARVVDAASRNAWKYHLALPPLRWAAQTGLSLISHFAPHTLLRQFDWIYSHDVTEH